MRAKLGIPWSVKIFTWLLICAGIFFGFVFFTNPGMSFPGATITDYSSQLGFYSTGVRVFGSVIALLISVILNNPYFLIITMVSRVFIEIGDIIVNIVLKGSQTNTIMISIIALFEIWAVLKLFKTIKAAG